MNFSVSFSEHRELHVSVAGNSGCQHLLFRKVQLNERFMILVTVVLDEFGVLAGKQRNKVTKRVKRKENVSYLGGQLHKVTCFAVNDQVH